MSHQKITKEDVGTAIATLKRDGKQISLAAIRTALGNRGSLTTIQEMKSEIDAAEAALKDPPQALQAFRQIWSEALQLGRSERAPEVADLEELNKALATELKALEGDVIACRNSRVEVQSRLEDTMTKLAATNQALAEARLEANQHAAKLLAVFDDHQKVLAQERTLSAAARAQVHELELKVTRLETELQVRRTFPLQSRRESNVQT